MTEPGGWDLKPNDVATRAVLGAKYGGNAQAGIAHSAVSPNILPRPMSLMPGRLG